MKNRSEVETDVCDAIGVPCNAKHTAQGTFVAGIMALHDCWAEDAKATVGERTFTHEGKSVTVAEVEPMVPASAPSRGIASENLRIVDEARMNYMERAESAERTLAKIREEIKELERYLATPFIGGPDDPHTQIANRLREIGGPNE